MRIHFLKNRDDDSYYVVDVLVDIKAYIEKRIPYSRIERDSSLKKTSEDTIIQAFKKQKFIRSYPCIPLKEGEDGKNNMLEKISCMIESLVEIRDQVNTFESNTEMHEKGSYKLLSPDKIRKLKEEIETLEMQALALVEE